MSICSTPPTATTPSDDRARLAPRARQLAKLTRYTGYVEISPTALRTVPNRDHAACSTQIAAAGVADADAFP